MAKKISRLTDLGIPKAPFKGLTDDMRKNEAQSKSLAVAQDVLGKQLKENAKNAEKLRRALGGTNVTNAQSLREYNALQREASRLLQENERLRNIQLRNDNLQEQLNQRRLRTERAQNAERRQTLTLYQQESARLTRLRNDYRSLALQHGANSRQARDLLNEITALDTRLRSLDATVGMHQRNVGNYSGALKGLLNMLTQVGLAFGVGALFQGIVGTEIKLQSLRIALQNITKSTDEYKQSLKFLRDLSVDYGQDLVVLTDTYKNFIASSESSNLSIKERQKIYESVIKAGSALTLSNENIEGSLLAISQMFSKGTIQAEELRGQLSERLPGSFGLLALALGKTEKELGKMLQAGEVLASDALPKLAIELEKLYGGKAQENLNTISGAWNQFRTKLGEYVTGANEAVKGTQLIARGIRFLGENLGGIIKTVGTLSALWLTYKARLIAVGVAQKLFATGVYDIQTRTQTLNYSFRNLSGNIRQGWQNATGFGGALKSIGWTTIIALVAKLGYEVYRLASGMALNEYRAERFAKAIEKVQTTMSKSSEVRTEKLRKETNEIKESNKSEAEKLRLIKALNEAYKAELEGDVKRLTVKHKLANAQRLEFIAKRDAYKAEVYGTGITANVRETATMIALEKMVTNTTEAEKAFREMLKQTKLELIGYDQTVSDLTVTQNAENEGKKESIKTDKEKVKSLEELAKAREYLANQEELQAKERDNLFENIDLNDVFLGEQKRNVLIAERNRINKEIEISQAKQKGLSEEQIKLLNEELIIARENEILAQMELDIRQTESNIEKELIRTRATQEIANLTIEGQLENENDNLEKKAELYNNLGQAVELSSDAIIKSIDKRIEAVDREIEAQKKLQDLIQEGAEQGSENANKSFAESQEAQRQAEIEKAQLEQRKQRVLMITAFLTSYTKNMEEGMPSGEAFARALADRATVEALISSMPAYFDGIEDTGTVNNPLDKNGGRVALLHDNERVVSAKENKELIKMGVSNSDLPYYVRQGMLMENSSFQNIEQSLELNGLTKKLDEVVNVIKNKPETTWNANTVVDGVLSLTRTTKRGNQIINDRFNYRA